MIVEAFKDALENGLEKRDQIVVCRTGNFFIRWKLNPSCQPMIPTYVFGWPTGREKGDYLAIDLGTLLRLSAHLLAS